MSFRPILSGIAMLMLLAAPALAASQQDRPSGPAVSEGLAVPRPNRGLPGVFEQESPVLLAQAGDPRITELQEQIRTLSGTLEELNFQILQMQEQMRKMQEDNEFRFQEIEGGAPKKKSDAAPATDGTTKAAVAEQPATGTAPSDGAKSDAAASDPVAAAIATSQPPVSDPAQPAAGDPAAVQTFGTITFDASGNVVGGAVGDQAITPSTTPPGGEAAPAEDQTTVAALPATDDPEELYRNSYEFILSGDYGTAEAGFRDHIARFPSDSKTADAHFWLGESLLGQQKYRDAAEVFLAANRDYPKSKKAPDMLLKLGVSLAGLEQRDVACATFGEVAKRYPNASAALKERLKQEQARAAC